MTSTTTRTTDAALPPLGAPGVLSRRLGFISVVACFGGLLFGYDTGVVNGAETPLQVDLGLNLVQLGLVVGLLPFGAALGALLTGKLSDAIGRRTSVILLAVLFFLGVLLVVFSPGGNGTFSALGYASVLAGRTILGLAVGGASVVVPVFLAELAPYEIRGSITGRNELAIVSGQLAAFVVNAVIASVFGTEGHIWRYMFAVAAIPAIFLFFGMLRMPESPRWLVKKGRVEDARRVLLTVRPPERADAEIDQLVEAVEDEAGTRLGLGGLLRSKWLLRIVAIGFGLSMVQSLTGTSSVMFFGTRVLQDSGMTAEEAVLANIAFGVVAVIGGIIAVRSMDRVNRRKTFLTGLTLTTSFLLLTAIAATVLPEGSAARPIVVLVLVVAFVLSMQTFLNIAVWVWLAEIFPLHMRGLGMGIAATGGWLVQGVLAIFVPSLLSSIGVQGVFLMFAVFGVLSILFVWKLVPETRGRTLESLERDVSTGAIYTMKKSS
ncbi:sugar porter family MFS transporter [Frondihabitans cladoniiphilus]|uniref:Sugar porter family MFS transporter n=1 Tax=Frondihabitans cladoniiphilus TaxID=715785 RepID=A0ABP8W0Y9_9MICO